MLSFVEDKAEEFFDDFAYNGRRSAGYILGKAGITQTSSMIAVAPQVNDLLTAAGVSAAGVSSHAATYIAAPLSALFSAALVQGDFLHRRKKLLKQYAPEIAAWLGNGKKPEDQNINDLYLAAFGDDKKGIPGNPVLREDLVQSSRERSWGIGISVASTTVGTFIAHKAHDEIEHFIKENVTTDPTGVTAITMLSLGALGFMIYQAIKTPLHYLAECCFGVEKETVNDKIGEIRRVREAGKQVSQERVFEAYIQAHPEIDDMVRKEYGKRFGRLRQAARVEVMQQVAPQLHLAEVTNDLNRGYIRPEELAFTAYGQVSGVERRGIPVKKEQRPDGSLTKLAGKAVWYAGFGKKGQQKVEDAIESIPAADDLPVYMGIAAESPDGNTQVAAQAYQETSPGRSVSFVEKLGRQRTPDGSMSFVEKVEASRSESGTLQRI